METRTFWLDGRSYTLPVTPQLTDGLQQIAEAQGKQLYVEPIACDTQGHIYGDALACYVCGRIDTAGWIAGLHAAHDPLPLDG